MNHKSRTTGRAQQYQKTVAYDVHSRDLSTNTVSDEEPLAKAGRVDYRAYEKLHRVRKATQRASGHVSAVFVVTASPNSSNGVPWFVICRNKCDGENM
jgi:hypothetical protein